MTGLELLQADLGDGIRAGFTIGLPVPDGPVWNMSATVGDARGGDAHRAEFESWLGSPVVYVRQVHGREVFVCDAPACDDAPVVDADAVVACGPGVAVAVLVADCVPVLLADGDARVVAAVHAGWRGVVSGVVPAALAAMVGRGAVRERVRAVIGPAICGSCYEVQPEFQREVAATVPCVASTTSWGTPGLDLPRAVRGQLLDGGVASITAVGGCTLEDERWFSHRGSGASGRPEGRLAAGVCVSPNR